MEKSLEKGVLKSILRIFSVSGDSICRPQSFKGVTVSEFNEGVGIAVSCSHDQPFVAHLFRTVADEGTVVCAARSIHGIVHSYVVTAAIAHWVEIQVAGSHHDPRVRSFLW
jgi:hypothetical protein